MYETEMVKRFQARPGWQQSLVIVVLIGKEKIFTIIDKLSLIASTNFIVLRAKNRLNLLVNI